MNKLFCILPLILLLQVGYCKNTFLCNFCIWSIELVKSILRSNLFYSRYGQEQYQSCIKSRTKAYCDGANINNWPFIYMGKFSVINSNEFCAKYKFCTNFIYKSDSAIKYKARLLSNNSSPIVNYETLATNPNNPLKFLVVADVHIDYAYKEVIL